MFVKLLCVLVLLSFSSLSTAGNWWGIVYWQTNSNAADFSCDKHSVVRVISHPVEIKGADSTGPVTLNVVALRAQIMDWLYKKHPNISGKVAGFTQMKWGSAAFGKTKEEVLAKAEKQSLYNSKSVHCGRKVKVITMPAEGFEFSIPTEEVYLGLDGGKERHKELDAYLKGI